ncbi:heterokaryon incompatibility protein-domain-containing protein [Trametes gibbosa]|nr:heterokaryon incompatibility protein-domain-containing protein [Trametes gibbosa]
MPRFLNTFTGQFEFKDDPSKVHYAILSHTWSPKEEGGEQSYAELLELQNAVERFWEDARLLGFPEFPRDDPNANLSIFKHPKLSKKIKGICKVAREAGYDLIWMDACCVDQSNSAELSEAINSMYEWYRLADVCYVYLIDVPNTDNPTREKSLFRLSRWHKRGWTLQELVAPEYVIFLTASWEFLGTRTGLASTLKQITNVNFDILTGMASLHSVSVARRMSWASKRETTRIEDRAYSLLGVFGVHLSPIYGEGPNAFLRLQEEIIRTIPDQSIFAWGPKSTVIARYQAPRFEKWQISRDAHSLLASSPNAFHDAGDIAPIRPLSSSSHCQDLPGWSNDRSPRLHCVFTPEGARIELFCVPLKDIPHIFELVSDARQTWAGGCSSCHGLPQAECLALLQCQTRAGSLIALPLCHREQGVRPSSEAYVIAPFMTCGHWLHEPPFRVIQLDHSLIPSPKYVISTLGSADLSPTNAILPLSHVRELLLQHYTRRSPTPKSALPGFVKEAGIDLWLADTTSSSPLSPMPAFDLKVAEERVQELKVHNFEIVTSACNHRDDHILLTTELTHSLGSIPGATQIIEIYLTLFHIPSGQRAGDLDTAARVSIKNRFQLSTSPHDSTTHLEAPCADDSEETSVTEFSSQTTSQRVVASATFIVHADMHWNEDTFKLRHLRVKLERPWPKSGSQLASPSSECTTLLVSVEVSERFRRERPAGLGTWRSPSPQDDALDE